MNTCDASLFTYREKRLRVAWAPGAPYFVDFGPTLPTTNAHVSLYAFTHPQSRAIAMSGSVKGWRPVHFSAELIVDCDTLQSAVDVEEVLRHKDVSFNKYSSGNKGFHYHIPRECEPSDDLCLRDKLLVESMFPGVELDTGIYRPMHLIRGIGCAHEVTRRRKALVDEFVGECVLSCNDITPSQADVQWFRASENCDSRSEWARFQDRVIMHHPVGSKGSRNLAIFCLAKDLYRSGLSSDVVQELCEHFNAAHQHPHDDAEVLRAVTSAIAQVGER